MGVTVMGAISHCLIKPVVVLARSTNALEYVEFLKEVKRNLKPEFRDKVPYLCYDAHRAHRGLVAKAYVPGNFVPLPIPTYSCEFNVRVTFTLHVIFVF